MMKVTFTEINTRIIEWIETPDTSIPDLFTVTAIPGGVRICWNPNDNEYTEIWRSLGGAYSLIAIVPSGTYCYDDIIAGGSLSYKIRGGIGYLYSPFCAEMGLPLCLVLTSVVINSVTINLFQTPGMPEPVIYWGDGDVHPLSYYPDEFNVNHAYAAHAVWYITITNSASLYRIYAGYYSASRVDGSIAVFKSCINLHTLALGVHENPWTGDLVDLPLSLRNLYIYHTTHITGNLSLLVNLQVVDIDCDAHGDLSQNTALMAIFFRGGCTCTVNVTNLLNATNLESYAAGSLFTGDVSNLLNLKQICIATPNQMTGRINNIDFEYIDCNGGACTMTLDVTGMTKLWKLSSVNNGNIIMGNIDSSFIIEQISVNGAVFIPQVLRFDIFPKLNTFYSIYVRTSAQVNQLLADLWANRDLTGTQQSLRIIDLRFGASGSPTGQGIIDKAALQAYRSPGNNPAYSLWTINTN